MNQMLDKDKGEMIDLLFRLIKIDTTNPPGDEYKCAKIVEGYFKRYNICFKRFEKVKGRTNVIGYIGKGKPSILIASHMDVVPAGDGWKTKPFSPVKKNGKVFGRGSSDNKGALAASLVLAKHLKKNEKKLKGQVLIAAVADEEKGSDLGIGYLLDEHKIKVDYAIIPDIGGYMKVIDIAEKGVLHVKVTAIGKQAHGSKPELGVNAILNMCRFLERLTRHKLRYRKHKFLKKPSVNVGIIKGGKAPNIVPGKCEVVIDIRYLPSQTPRQIVSELKVLSKDLGRFEFSINADIKPSEVDANNVLVKALKKSIKSVKKVNAKVIGLGGATVAKQLIHKGITAVGVGPGNADVAHIANEYIEIKELLDFTGIMYKTVFDILK